VYSNSDPYFWFFIFPSLFSYNRTDPIPFSQTVTTVTVRYSHIHPISTVPSFTLLLCLPLTLFLSSSSIGWFRGTVPMRLARSQCQIPDSSYLHRSSHCRIFLFCYSSFPILLFLFFHNPCPLFLT